MGEETKRFESCIDKLHERNNKQGISSTASNCRYSIIEQMIGKPIHKIDKAVLKESNLEEYLTSRLWSKKTFLGAAVESAFTWLRAAEYRSYVSQKL